MKSKIFEWLFGIILTIIGLYFIFNGINKAISFIKFKMYALEITATISDITNYKNSKGNEEATVSVVYTFNGIEYNNLLDYFDSSMHIGKEVLVFVDKTMPSNMKSEKQGISQLVELIIGIPFFGVGFGILMLKLNDGDKSASLIENGKLINAKFDDIAQTTYYTVNGKHYYYIICKWENVSSNKIYTYRSPNLWYNPQDIISKNNISTFPIYINPKKPNKYYFPLDILNSDE